MDPVTLGMSKAYTKSQSRVAARRASSQLRGMVPVMRRAANLGAGVKSNGTDTSGWYRRCHPVVVSCSDIRLVFSNYFAVNAAVIADNVNDITVKASVEIPVSAVTFTMGSRFLVTFGGQRSAVVPAGGLLVSDPIPLTAIAGQFVYVNTYVSVASAGMVWPTSFTTLGSGSNPNFWEGGAVGAPATDVIDTATNVTNANIAYYGPSAIVGTLAATAPAATCTGLFFGDSILYGSGDNTALWEGYLGRAAAAQGVPYVNVSHPGEQAVQVTGVQARHRLPYAAGADFAVTNYGRNDLANVSGITLATHQANCLEFWTQLSSRGLRVHQATVTPKSTTTDTWTTVANQTADTANSYESNRVAFNTWLRDGAPILAGVAVASGSSAGGTIRKGDAAHPLAGVLEIADIVESARNSGKFKVGRLVNDCSYTSGTRTISSATAAFTSADIGAAVTIGGAGAAGATLVGGRIASVTNSTTVIYEGPAVTSQTASGQMLSVGAITNDGTHPTTSGHALIAAAIDLTVL